MQNRTVEYFFSVKAYFVAVLFVTFTSLLLSYLSYSTYFTPSSYNENKFIATIFALMLVAFWIAISKKLFKITCALLKSRPALALTPLSLIDNLNGNKVNWNNVLKIDVQVHFTGREFRQFITVEANNPKRRFKIYDMIIKCNRRELVEQLINFQKQAVGK